MRVHRLRGLYVEAAPPGAEARNRSLPGRSSARRMRNRKAATENPRGRATTAGASGLTVPLRPRPTGVGSPTARPVNVVFRHATALPVANRHQKQKHGEIALSFGVVNRKTWAHPYIRDSATTRVERCPVDVRRGGFVVAMRSRRSTSRTARVVWIRGWREAVFPARCREARRSGRARATTGGASGVRPGAFSPPHPALVSTRHRQTSSSGTLPPYPVANRHQKQKSMAKLHCLPSTGKAHPISEIPVATRIERLIETPTHSPGPGVGRERPQDTPTQSGAS